MRGLTVNRFYLFLLELLLLEGLDLLDEERAFEEEDGFDRLPDDRVAGDFLEPELLEGAALR